MREKDKNSKDKKNKFIKSLFFLFPHFFLDENAKTLKNLCGFGKFPSSN